jgi:hypothetical protein
LFEERETLKLREAEFPKYELVLKLLKNRGTWDEFLKANNEQAASNTIKESLGQKKKKKGNNNNNNVTPNIKEKVVAKVEYESDSDSDLEFGMPKEQPKPKEEEPSNVLVQFQQQQKSQDDEVTNRLIKLITTNLNDTLHKLNDLSCILENEFQKVLATKMDHSRLRNVQEIPLQTVLESIYDMNCRIQEMNSMHLARAKQREKEDEVRREILLQKQQQNCLKVVLQADEEEDYIKLIFFDISEEGVEKKVDVNKDDYISTLEERVSKLKSDLAYERGIIEKQQDELQLKGHIISSAERDLNDKKRRYKERVYRQEAEISELMKRVSELERGVQTRPISVVFNITAPDEPVRPPEPIIVEKIVYVEKEVPRPPSPVVQTPTLTPVDFPPKEEIKKQPKKTKVKTPEPKLERSPSVLGKNGRNSRNKAAPSPEPERQVKVISIGDMKPPISTVTRTPTPPPTEIKQPPRSKSVLDMFEKGVQTEAVFDMPNHNVSPTHNNQMTINIEKAPMFDDRPESTEYESNDEIAPFVSPRTNKPRRNGGNASHRSDDIIEPIVTSRSTRHVKPKRHFGDVPKNERLAQILAKTVKFKRDGQVKSLLWLLRLMSSIYKNKIEHDSNDEKIHMALTSSHDMQASTTASDIPTLNTARMSLPEFVFEHLKQIYGTQKLVDEYAGSVIATILKYKTTDKRVEIFGRFVNEEWDLPILDMYLKTWKMVEEFKHGPEFCHQKPLDDMPKYARLSKVRALYILKSLKQSIPSLIDQIVRLTDRMCVEVTEEEFKKAMTAAGYKYIQSQFNPMELWGVDAVTAKQIINKCDFLDIVCQVVALTVSEEDERNILNNNKINVVVHDGVNVLNLRGNVNVRSSDTFPLTERSTMSGVVKGEND